ncbi:MAG: hypothetical protein ACFFD4_22250 [Candidatus Odinarchaeota archaeon]
MTLKKYYENDAWEVLEQYYDRIRDYLLRANIKGEERQRVINELMGHVQMKADEIIEKKDTVSYADVLEIMKELGSPVEIANAYAQDEDNLATTPEELLAEKKVVSGEQLSVTDQEGIVSEPAMKIPVDHRDDHPRELAGPTSGYNTVLEVLLLLWRLFQVMAFLTPWIFLGSMLVSFTEWYGVYDRDITWVTWSSSYYLSDYLQHYLAFLLLFVVIEHYMIREYIIPRIQSPSSHQQLATAVYRFGILSTAVLYVLMAMHSQVAFFYVTAGLIVLFINETLASTGLKEYVHQHIRALRSKGSSKQKEYSKQILLNLFFTIVISYGSLIILLGMLFRDSPFIGFAMIGNIPLAIYSYLFAGTAIVFFLLFLEISITSKISTDRVYPVEISTIVWAFRLFLAALIVLSLAYPGQYDVFLWTSCVVIPMFFIENIFTKTIVKLTDLDFTLTSSIRNGTNELRLIASSLKSAFNQKYGRITIIESTLDTTISTNAVMSSNAANAAHVGEINSNTPVGVTDYRYSQVPARGYSPDPVAELLPQKSVFVSFIRDSIFLYVKVAILFLFLPVLYYAANFWDYYADQPYSGEPAIAYIIFILLLSSYKLYSLSKRISFNGSKKPGLPYYYWLLTALSWILLGYMYPLLIFVFPFVLLQVTSSIKLVQGKSTKFKDRMAESDTIKSRRPSGLVADSYYLER